MGEYVAGEGAAEGFDPAGAARQALAQLGDTAPAALVVFVAHRGDGEKAAPLLAPLARGAAVVVVECAGVLTSQGEHEGRGTAALALGAPGLTVEVRPLPAEAGPAGEIIARVATESPTLAWLILTPPLYSPDVVAATDSVSAAAGMPVVGGGAAGVFVAPAGSSAPAARAAGVLLALRAPGLRAACTASPALRVLTPWRKVDEVSGPFVVSAGGASMLEWISETPGSQAEGSPTFVAVRAQDPDAAPLIRTVAGVDPRRGAVAVNEPIPVGAEVALGVWDGGVARQDLTARLATLARGLGGAAPVGAIVMTCLGRGQDLFGSAGVDAATVRARFPGVPFAGMFSQFEIARFDGAARIHLYSASVAVLYRPS